MVVSVTGSSPVSDKIFLSTSCVKDVVSPKCDWLGFPVSYVLDVQRRAAQS